MEYVLSFTTRVRGKDRVKQVLLIEKKKPDWQAGRWNLPGGKIEPGESPGQAASRELLEETNLRTHGIWPMGVIRGDGFTVHVIKIVPNSNDTIVQTTDERPFWKPITAAVGSARLIGNLRVILPMCAYGIRGWEIHDEPGGVGRIVFC